MRVKLEEVCVRGTSNIKQVDVTDKTGDYPIYGASGYIGNVDFYHQENPYVAVIKDGAGIGRTTLHPAKSSVIGTMQYLIPKENILPKYLFYVVRYMKLEKYYTGATIPHIYFKDYKREEFNLESIEIQAKIVDILGKCEKIIEARRKEIISLDNLIKARFVELFGDLKIVNTWKREKISVVCNEIVDCVNKTAPVVDSITPYKMLRTTNVRNGRVDVCNVKYVEEDVYKKWTRRSVPQRGDLLLTREAPVGEVGVIDSDDEVFLGQRLVSYRINPEKMDEIFLLYQMISPYFQDELVGVAKGSTVKHLPVPVCTEFMVHVPPLELQKTFSQFVKQVDKSKVAVQKALDETQVLFDSLMQKYFG